MKSENIAAYIYAAALFVGPILWTLVAHKLDLHGVDFGPVGVVVCWVLGGLVAFSARWIRLLSNKKLKLPFGIEVEDKGDGA